MEEYQGWSAFADKFKPIKNKFSNDPDSRMFETYGEEWEFIKEQDPRYVWTWVTGDMCDIIVTGMAYVNRFGYYVTEVPWEDDMDTVLLSVEKECECYNEETGEGSEDCQICEGYGLVTEYVG